MNFALRLIQMLHVKTSLDPAKLSQFPHVVEIQQAAVQLVTTRLPMFASGNVIGSNPPKSILLD